MNKLRQIEILREIADGTRTPPNAGLCCNANLNAASVQIMFAKWPKFSGDYHFPIPSTRKNRTPEHQYVLTPSESMYKYKYGKLRRELAGFVADELEKLQ